MHDDLNGRDVAVGVNDAEGINLDGAVLQLDTVHELTLDAGLHVAVQARHVGLADLILGVGEAIRQLAVVGEQQQTGRIDVEATHVVEALGVISDQIGNRGASLRVTHRRDGPNRLVDGQHDVLRLVENQALAVDVNDLRCGVNAHALAAHDRAVDAHAAIRDHLFGRAPGRDAGLGEYLLQAHAPLGVRVSPHSSSSNSSSASALGK